MKVRIVTMVTLGAISGQMIRVSSSQVAGAVEARRLEHLLADALHAGEQHEGRKADPMPDIGEDDAAERRALVAEPGRRRNADERQQSG